ncbi:MAG: adenosylmethionine--8-amino-7-oxononanoate transaminase [Flavobacteriales bacterium]|nr:adenosylmethionine--8-amino-7-oxononanoate transaminase [Flavobacteriales bacterium]MCW8913822.1 adenosylmethionine--8-amino-7-oxononanoate transaminase [Flavobacteriales bacterium]MCW8937938.1 adenosylmethionine--8-amino-7-oxononanoate transaminase [Flavobacteriales bacterium]MCW8968277.1 adenosylmethionine--8-amino-7-oxononanoate transaminase [Flavobacteriales bacterium]MCW8989683.1 adenosylmethionine--8-amino-7-oxononanoate transaminase [Flavobacteriales bacterium]
MSLKQKDKQYIWHPFDQQKGADIIPIVKGLGAFVFDEHGKKYIDGFSSWWVNIHGHAHPYIAQKIYQQALELEHIAFGGFTHPQAVNLSERLIHLLPNNIEKLFFSDNGSTANEVALKMAVQYWFNQGKKRTRFIALENDYHGDTFGSMSLTARGGFNEPFETLLFDVDFIDAPTNENKDSVLNKLENHLKTNEIAAFIFEPIIQGAAGMLMHSPEILSEMIGLCKTYGVVTIADEVFTGFGRTGKWFASDYFQHKPDVFCLSKGITGGFMPLGITAVSKDIYQAFYSDNAKHTFLHGHSYTGNPLACAAANASLDLFEVENTFEKIENICQLQKTFIESIQHHKQVRNARHFGTIAAIELQTDGKSNYFNSKGKEVYQFLLKKGIILRPLGNVITIIPPYCIVEEDLKTLYQGIVEYLNQ